MSFSDRPTVPIMGKLGCLAYFLAASPVAMFSLATGLLGRCDSDGGCYSYPLFFLIFPGLMILIAVGGIMLLKWVTRDKP